MPLNLHAIGALLGRFLLALLFVYAGAGKLEHYAETASYMNSFKVPPFLLPFVIAVEILGGLAIALGWRARVFALLLGAFSILSAAIFHHDFAAPQQTVNFLKDLAIAGGLLTLAVHGPGPLSLDAFFRKGADRKGRLF